MYGIFVWISDPMVTDGGCKKRLMGSDAFLVSDVDAQNTLRVANLDWSRSMTGKKRHKQ